MHLVRSGVPAVLALSLGLSLALVPGCAADPDPGDGDDPSGQGGALPGGDDHPGELAVVAEVRRASCDDLSAEYKVVSATRDGVALEAPVCEWHFDDGATSSDCSGVHLFTEAGVRGGSVIVTDPETGLSVSTEALPDRLFDPLDAELSVSAPACGLSIDYAVSIRGGTGTTRAATVVSPGDLVTAHEALAHEGTIEVSEPGTYLVETFVEDETATWLCTAHLTQEVTVVACDEPCDEHGVVHSHE